MPPKLLKAVKFLSQNFKITMTALIKSQMHRLKVQTLEDIPIALSITGLLYTLPFLLRKGGKLHLRIITN